MNNNEFKVGDRIMWVSINAPQRTDNIYFGTILELNTNDNYLVKFDNLGVSDNPQYQHKSHLRHIESMKSELPIKLI